MKPKIIAVFPAYNAAKTLVPFLRIIPSGIFDEVILVDDCSTDGTYALAKKQKGISVFQTPRNLGYGGNLKYCLTLALEHGADVIIELHPDGEYGTDGIVPGLAEVNKGAMLVLGNRFLGRLDGMYWWKYIITRLLSTIDNVVLGTNIPDAHQGFRVYTKQLLEHVNWKSTHDDYLFSFEIICQTIIAELTITSVPVAARYRGTKRGATWGHSIRYSLGTGMVLMKVLLEKLGYRQRLFSKPLGPAPCPICHTAALSEAICHLDTYTTYDCHICRNAFTWPRPNHVYRYYPDTYYREVGFAGWAKEQLFGWAQRRRAVWVKQYDQGKRILDVGSGSGRFGNLLRASYQVTSLDPYYQGKNQQIIHADFLSWKSKKRFDAVVFWESLEHVPDPAASVARVRTRLTPGGVLCIEYPRFQALEARVFGKYWFHLDMPRHLVHFRDNGLRQMVEGNGFIIRAQRTVFALEYAPMGLLLSTLRVVGLERYWAWFLPTLVIWLPVSLALYMVGHSPIGLLVAQKDATMRTRV